MKLLTFDSYEEYKNVQVAANRLKYDHVYAEDPELQRIAAHIRDHHRGARRGLCHGVRNGYEVRKLRALLPTIDILGTDISETAGSLPHCLVWDMHEVQPDWVGATDFMYSNSWDHTYDPALLFSRWSTCLSDEGRLYLSYTDLHSEQGVSARSKVDVFGCSWDELLRILQQHFVLEDVLEVAPRLTGQTWRRRLTHMRAGRIRSALMQRLTSRRVFIAVLRRPG